MRFKEEHTYENRVEESTRIRNKYPDRIPVIVEKLWKSHMNDIDRNKFLVPSDLTVGQFVYVIRKRIRMEAEKALFIFVNKQIPCNGMNISQVYSTHRNSDGFLYLEYSEENVFG